MNTAMTATEAELGWFAGLLEGEGCITFHTRSKKASKNGTFDIVVGAQITNTDLAIINKLVEILDKCGLSWFVRAKKVYSDKHTPCYFIECRQQKMLLRSLNILVPYMHGTKKDRAVLVSKYLDKRIRRLEKYGPNHVDGRYSTDEISLIPRDSTPSTIRCKDIVHAT